MNVRELIEVLSQYPDDTRVVVDGYEDGYDDLSPELISIVELALNANRYWYVGRHAGKSELSDQAQANARFANAIVLGRPRHLTE